MDSLSRISGLLETARDLTLEAARDATSSRYTTNSSTQQPAEITRLLDSRRDGEILDGLRRVLSLHYSDHPVLQYFTSVVKNIANPDAEIKKLIYVFLIQHAEAAPDTALLSINTIQKGLSDGNPATRALALKTMSSIRVPVISQIVALGIKRGVADMSPVVRRTAAFAIPKCYRLDVTHLPLLEEQLAILLADRQYHVVGAAVQAFLSFCPTHWHLIHPNYMSLVNKIVDMDEWGQLATLQLMLTYSRNCFPPNHTKLTNQTHQSERNETEAVESRDHLDLHEPLDPHLQSLLQAIQPLLQSRNAAIVVAVARCYLYLAPKPYILLLPGPLLSILRAAPDISSLAISIIANIVVHHPAAFTPYTTHFLLRASDSPQIATSKLTILSLLFPHVQPNMRGLILTDLAHHTTSFISSSSPDLAHACVLAIGQCASYSPTPGLRARCLHILLSHLSSPDPSLISASLDQIRVLIQRDPSAHANTILRLVKHLDRLSAPSARSAIVWLVGEYASGPDTLCIAADIWRILLLNFALESVSVQSHILLLAAKVYLHDRRPKHSPSAAHHATPTPKDDLTDRIGQMLTHTFLLARYAHSFHLRDRARFLRNLLLDCRSTDLAALLLLCPKPTPTTSAPSSSSSIFVASMETYAQRNATKLLLGYASWLLGFDIRGAQSVPDWTTVSYGAAERAQSAFASSASASASDGVAMSSAASFLDRHEQPTSVKSNFISHISVSAPFATASTGGAGEKKGADLDRWLDEDEHPRDLHHSSQKQDDQQDGSESTESTNSSLTDDDDESDDEVEDDHDSMQHQTDDDDDDDRHERRPLVKP